ncbi:MAG: hypothetical protein OXQ89_02290 [Rhodospirillaceae bacterium]|nr:hypothetical protein [Rhodospirillaceae bacterium]
MMMMMTMPTLETGYVRVRRAASERARALTVGTGFVFLLVGATALAQPGTFCLDGVEWQRVPGIPPAQARELTIPEKLSLGSQMLFGSARLRDEMLMSAHGPDSCASCHDNSERTEQDASWSIDNLIVVQPSRRDRPFWGQDHEAFLVRPTENRCDPETPGVYWGAPSLQGVLGHERSDSHMRFIIESSRMLEELDRFTAPVLAEPGRR